MESAVSSVGSQPYIEPQKARAWSVDPPLSFAPCVMAVGFVLAYQRRLCPVRLDAEMKCLSWMSISRHSLYSLSINSLRTANGRHFDRQTESYCHNSVPEK